MAGTGEADDNRLEGRMPRAARRGVSDQDQAASGEDGADTPDEEEIDAVNRLLGFLRNDEDE